VVVVDEFGVALETGLVVVGVHMGAVLERGAVVFVDDHGGLNALGGLLVDHLHRLRMVVDVVVTACGDLVVVCAASGVEVTAAACGWYGGKLLLPSGISTASVAATAAGSAVRETESNADKAGKNTKDCRSHGYGYFFPFKAKIELMRHNRK